MPQILLSGDMPSERLYRSNTTNPRVDELDAACVQNALPVQLPCIKHIGACAALFSSIYLERATQALLSCGRNGEWAKVMIFYFQGDCVTLS